MKISRENYSLPIHGSFLPPPPRFLASIGTLKHKWSREPTCSRHKVRSKGERTGLHRTVARLLSVVGYWRHCGYHGNPPPPQLDVIIWKTPAAAPSPSPHRCTTPLPFGGCWVQDDAKVAAVFCIITANRRYYIFLSISLLAPLE